MPHPLTQDCDPIIPEGDPPNCVTRSSQFPQIPPGCQIPQLDPPVVSTADDEAVVELQACYRVVVRTEAMNALDGGEVEDDDAAIGAAGDEAVVGELKLADEGGVALEQGEAFAGDQLSPLRRSGH